MQHNEPVLSTRMRLIWLLFLVVSGLWIAGFGFLFVGRWSTDLAPVDRTYVLREQTCKARYREVDARERCLLIMDLERFQTRSIMIANRALACLGPPLIGFGVLVYLRRRNSRRKGPRK